MQPFQLYIVPHNGWLVFANPSLVLSAGVRTRGCSMSAIYGSLWLLRSSWCRNAVDSHLDHVFSPFSSLTVSFPSLESLIWGWHEPLSFALSLYQKCTASSSREIGSRLQPIVAHFSENRDMLWQRDALNSYTNSGVVPHCSLWWNWLFWLFRLGCIGSSRCVVDGNFGAAATCCKSLSQCTVIG